MQNERGKIVNRARAKQLYDHSGMIFGNISPTDIDGLIEYKNKAFIILEYKHITGALSYGQKLALERLTDSLDKPALCVIAIHAIDDANIDIPVADCIVIEYRYKKRMEEAE